MSRIAAHASYNVYFDLTGSRLFNGANDDVSAYVKRVVTQHGMTAPGERMGRSATCDLTLRNASGKFSPQRGTALAGLTVGIAVKVTMTYGGVTRQLFIGRIDALQPVPGTRNERHAFVRCYGFMAALAKEEVFLPTQTQVTTDAALSTLLEKTTQQPPWITTWRIGVSGFSEIGVTTKVGGVSQYFVNETGQTTLDYVGDNWHDGVSAYSAIAEVLDGEAGWLFEDTDGKLHFWNRNHLYKQLIAGSSATFDGAQFTGAEYQYGQTLVNGVQLTFNPRLVGSSNEVLGTLGQELFIPANGSAQTTIRFDSGSGNKISALSALTPSRYLDYRARHYGGNALTVRRNAAKDFTKYVDCAMNLGADRADLTFINHYGAPLVVLAGAQVRGIKLTDFGNQRADAFDAASIASYGKQMKKLDAPAINDAAFARNMANWLVQYFKTPLGNLTGMAFMANSNAAAMAQARDRLIGDVVTISETQVGVSAGTYVVVGMRHEITPREHRLKWSLEPTPTNKFWFAGVTGYSEIGQTTNVGL